jgi:serine protease Do
MPVKGNRQARLHYAAKQQGGGSQSNSGTALKGMTVANMNPDIAGQLGVPVQTRGVVVMSVDPGSAAEDAGITRGDVIQEVNRKPVSDAGDLQAQVQQAGNQPVLLLINRQGKTLYIVVQP